MKPRLTRRCFQCDLWLHLPCGQTGKRLTGPCSDACSKPEALASREGPAQAAPGGDGSKATLGGSEELAESVLERDGGLQRSGDSEFSRVFELLLAVLPCAACQPLEEVASLRTQRGLLVLPGLFPWGAGSSVPRRLRDPVLD